MVVFGSWCPTLLIRRPSFCNSTTRVHCTISWHPPVVFPSYRLGELHWLHNWSSYPMQWILILTSQLVCGDRGIEWFRIERFWVLWQKQRSDKLQPWPMPTFGDSETSWEISSQLENAKDRRRCYSKEFLLSLQLHPLALKRPLSAATKSGNSVSER